MSQSSRDITHLRNGEKMKFESVISGKNLKKKYKGFTLNIPVLEIPKGFSTALIGENGAGKTTLIDMMTGIKLDYSGNFTYFGQYSDTDREKNPVVKTKIGYTGTGSYYLQHWTLKQAMEMQDLLFPDFDVEKYKTLCAELGITKEEDHMGNKKISALSDGNRTKLMLAGVLSRETDLLILDEPASPLDPLMRDKLCDIMRSYLTSKDGEHSIIFSTHNISDMESVTDYALIVEHGEIVEQGFVEDLKEKYVLIKGESADVDTARKAMFTLSSNPYGFEGLCLSEHLDMLAGLDISAETPSLSQIAVGVMKNHTAIHTED